MSQPLGNNPLAGGSAKKDVKLLIASVSDLKESLEIRHNKHDAILIDLLHGAQGWVEQYCNRRFSLCKYEDEEHDGGENDLQALNYPVRDLKIFDCGKEVSPDDYTVNKRIGYVNLRNDKEFSEGLGVVSISYIGGYEEVPRELSQLVIRMAKLMYEQRHSMGKSVEKVNNSEVQWHNTIVDLDMIMLNKFKRVSIGL